MGESRTHTSTGRERRLRELEPAQRRTELVGLTPVLSLSDQDTCEAFHGGDLLLDLKRALAAGILDQKMALHIERNGETGNRRTKQERKHLLTESGALPVATLRDWHVRFDAQVIGKHVHPRRNLTRSAGAVGGDA